MERGRGQGQKPGTVTYRGPRNPRWTFGAKETSSSLHSGEGKIGPAWVRENVSLSCPRPSSGIPRATPIPKPLDTHRLSRQPPRPNLPIVSLEEEDVVKQAQRPDLSHTQPPPLPRPSTTLTRSPSSPGGPGRPWAPVSPWKMVEQVRGGAEPLTQADTDCLQLTNQFPSLSSCWDPQPPTSPPLHRRSTPSSQHTMPLYSPCVLSPQVALGGHQILGHPGEKRGSAGEVPVPFPPHPSLLCPEWGGVIPKNKRAQVGLGVMCAREGPKPITFTPGSPGIPRAPSAPARPWG